MKSWLHLSLEGFKQDLFLMCPGKQNIMAVRSSTVQQITILLEQCPACSLELEILVKLVILISYIFLPLFSKVLAASVCLTNPQHIRWGISSIDKLHNRLHNWLSLHTWHTWLSLLTWTGRLMLPSCSIFPAQYTDIHIFDREISTLVHGTN